MSKRLYLFMIEIFWFIEHRKNETIACYGYSHRKLWEHKYVSKFNENIYGQKL